MSNRNTFNPSALSRQSTGKIEDGYEREAIQRKFSKFISQTIKRDLKKNHQKVLEQFYVGAGQVSILGTESFKYRFMDQKFLCKKWNTFLSDWPSGHNNPCSSKVYAIIRKAIHILQQNIM